MPDTPAGPSLHLPLVFEAGAELAKAAADLPPAEWRDVPADIDGPESPHFTRWCNRHQLLNRIERASARLKRRLGATGPLTLAEALREGGNDWEAAMRAAPWEHYPQKFECTNYDGEIRLALTQLAEAAVILSGFALNLQPNREPCWSQRESGFRLLARGLPLLYRRLPAEDQLRIQSCLWLTHEAIKWPEEPAGERPSRGDLDETTGPGQPFPVSNSFGYTACAPDHWNAWQKAEAARVESEQGRFLFRATVAGFAELTKRTVQALEAMTGQVILAGKAVRSGVSFDPSEWGAQYDRAFRGLWCLRRAAEVPPADDWPEDAQRQRVQIAEAAGRVLEFVGSSTEKQATMKPEDAHQALQAFREATVRLLETAPGALAGPRHSTQPSSGRRDSTMSIERPSPFTIPESCYQFAEEIPSEEAPLLEPAARHRMTVRDLIQNLINFADFYEHQTTASELAAYPALKLVAVATRDANARTSLAHLRATEGLDQLRGYLLAQHGEELTIGSARRLLGDLVRVCGLSVGTAEELELKDAVGCLEGAHATEGGTRRLRGTTNGGTAIVFSADYRSCRWGTHDFLFSPKQAAVVQALAEARQQGTPALSKELLLDAAGSAMDGKGARLRDLFKTGSKTHPAWTTMIVPGGTQGTFRLADPPS